MTNHYIATHDGVTFTRSTANRVYTHMVVSIEKISARRQAAEESTRDAWKRDRKYTQEVADGKRPTNIIPADGFHSSYEMLDADGKPTAKYLEYTAQRQSYDVKRVMDAKARLALGEEGHVTKALKDFDDRRAKATNNSSDGQFFYCDAGWCGRLDLAQKLAATTRQYSYGVLILPAVQVIGRPKKGKKS